MGNVVFEINLEHLMSRSRIFFIYCEIEPKTLTKKGL